MIELRHVSKYYPTDKGRKYVLENVSLTIPDGVNLGILGRNGAGKSTLLRMLGGIDFPSEGVIHSDNTFSWPMGLAGGFQGSMTGRQNVKFVCRIYGKSPGEIQKAIDYVQEFSEIGDYFDQPIKSYSSGMKSRLSFGLSLYSDFDYLIIDETLSVGDVNFQNKAKTRLREKIERCNILLVSHSMSILQELYDVDILLHEGKVYYYDDIKDATVAYTEINKPS